MNTLYCGQCDRQVRVSEGRAFGHDPSRATLACGHVVTRVTEVAEQFEADSYEHEFVGGRVEDFYGL